MNRKFLKHETRGTLLSDAALAGDRHGGGIFYYRESKIIIDDFTPSLDDSNVGPEGNNHWDATMVMKLVSNEAEKCSSPTEKSMWPEQMTLGKLHEITWYQYTLQLFLIPTI